MSDNVIIIFRFLYDLVHGPTDCRAQTFAQHRSTRLADGRQLAKSPFLRTVLPKLAHEQTVRQHDEVHMPYLALAATQLTISHTKFLLPSR